MRYRDGWLLACCWLIATGLCSQNCDAQIESITATIPAADAGPAPPVVWEICPSPEPDPALKYSLWPERMELIDGNAMVPIQRALVLMLDRSNRAQSSKTIADNYENWFNGPIEQLPKEEIRQHLNEYRNVINELKRAEFMRDSTYALGIDNLRGLDVVTFLLPEVQNMRELGRLLVLETRLALAEKRFDDAIQCLRVAMRLADTSGNSGDLLICKLVGIAIASHNLEQAQIAMSQPGMPNLYWGFASIPSSLYDCRPAMDFEANLPGRVFPSLAKLPDEEMEPAAWHQRILQATHDLTQLGGSASAENYAGAEIAAGLYLVARHESAREELIAGGMDADRVARMSAAEAVVRATAASLERIQSDFGKWRRLPKSMRKIAMKEMEAAVVGGNSGGAPGPFSDISFTLASQLLPATVSVLSAELRCEQLIARLVTVESIRDFASTHGRLPKSLDEITHLPPWDDPITSAPFEYRSSSDTEATLTSAPRHHGDRDTTIVLKLKTATP